MCLIAQIKQCNSTVAQKKNSSLQINVQIQNVQYKRKYKIIQYNANDTIQYNTVLMTKPLLHGSKYEKQML